jgi:hypothetical protein
MKPRSKEHMLVLRQDHFITALVVIVGLAAAAPVDYSLVEPQPAPSAVVEQLADCPFVTQFIAPNSTRFVCVNARAQVSLRNSYDGTLLWSANLYGRFSTWGFLDIAQTVMYFSTQWTNSSNAGEVQEWLTAIRVSDGLKLQERMVLQRFSATEVLRPISWYAPASSGLYLNTFYGTVLQTLLIPPYTQTTAYVHLSAPTANAADLWVFNTSSASMTGTLTLTHLLLIDGSNISAIPRRTKADSPIPLWGVLTYDGSPVLLDSTFDLSGDSPIALFYSNFRSRFSSRPNGLYAIRLDDGRVNWNISSANLYLQQGVNSWNQQSPPGSFLPGTTDFFVTNAGTGVLIRVNRTNGPIANYTLPCTSSVPAYLRGDLYIVRCLTNAVDYSLWGIRAYGTSEGSWIWSRNFTNTTFLSNVGEWNGATQVIGATSAGYFELTWADGTIVWQRPFSYPVIGSLYSCNNASCLLSTSTSIELVSRADGSLIWGVYYETWTYALSNTTRWIYIPAIASITFDSTETGCYYRVQNSTYLQTFSIFSQTWGTSATPSNSWVAWIYRNLKDGTVPAVQLFSFATPTLVNFYQRPTTFPGVFLFGVRYPGSTIATLTSVNAATGLPTWTTTVPVLPDEALGFTSWGTTFYRSNYWLLQGTYSFSVVHLGNGSLMRQLNYTWKGWQCDLQDCDKGYWTRAEYNTTTSKIASVTHYHQPLPIDPNITYIAPANCTLVLFENAAMLLNMSSLELIYNTSFLDDNVAGAIVPIESNPFNPRGLIVGGLSGRGLASHIVLLKFDAWTGRLLYNYTGPSVGTNIPVQQLLSFLVHNVTDMFIFNAYILGLDAVNGKVKYNISTVSGMIPDLATSVSGLLSTDIWTMSNAIAPPSQPAAQLLRFNRVTGKVMWDLRVAGSATSSASYVALSPDTRVQQDVYGYVAMPRMDSTFVVFCLQSGLPIFGAGYKDTIVQFRLLNDSWTFVHASGMVSRPIFKTAVKTNLPLVTPPGYTDPFSYITPGPKPRILQVNSTTLMAFDLKTGLPQWNTTLRQYLEFQWLASEAPVYAKDRAYFIVTEIVGSPDWRVVVVDLKTGAIAKVLDPWVYRRQCGEPTNPVYDVTLSASESFVYFTSGSRCIWSTNTTSLVMTYAQFSNSTVQASGKVLATPKYLTVADDSNGDVYVMNAATLQFVTRRSYSSAWRWGNPEPLWLGDSTLWISYNGTLQSVAESDLLGGLAANVEAVNVTNVWGSSDRSTIFYSSNSQLYLAKSGASTRQISALDYTTNPIAAASYAVELYSPINSVVLVSSTGFLAAVRNHNTLLWSLNFTALLTAPCSVLGFGNATDEALLMLSCRGHLVGVDLFTGMELFRLLDVAAPLATTRAGYSAGVAYGAISGGGLQFAAIMLNYSTAPISLATNATGCVAQAEVAAQATFLAQVAAAVRAAANQAPVIYIQPSSSSSKDVGPTTWNTVTGLGILLIFIAAALFTVVGVVVGKIVFGSASASTSSSAAKSLDAMRESPTRQVPVIPEQPSSSAQADS